MDKNVYEDILKELSIDNMYKHMEVLVDDIGERLSGTEELEKTAVYIEKQLKDYGLAAGIDRFPMYHSFPGEAQLKVLSPETLTIDARPVCHISSTPPCGLEGDLLYLGSGDYADYEGIDVTNKILLTDMNWSPARPEKARIAWEKGAKALIIMNWGKPDDQLIQMGAVKSQWGNPTPEDMKDIPQITVISISRASGEYLKGLCLLGKVRVWLMADATREWVNAAQPTGFIKGGMSNGQFLLVGSHIDAWGKSAICNAAGNALAIEMARLFYKYRGRLKRDVVFIFWDGHEIAEGGGSAWYCDTNWGDITRNCVAYINIDTLAIKGTTVPGLEGQPEMKRFLMETVREIWGEEAEWHDAYKGGGDSSFFGVGAPYINFATEYTEEMLKELNYAFYSPWLHSDSDTTDKIDRKLYIKHSEYFCHLLYQLVNRDIIPYDPVDLADDVLRQYEKLCNEAGYGAAMISDLKETINAYRRAASDIKKIIDSQDGRGADEINALNRVLIGWLRETAVFRSFAGRYGQDPCGCLKTENPFPALYDALINLSKHQKDSHEYNLWTTKVVKEKNRVFDALNNSIGFAENILSLGAR